jgi:hypothetical protein
MYTHIRRNNDCALRALHLKVVVACEPQQAIRPLAYFTNKLKKQQLRIYGYTDTNPKLYEEDHLIPLEIGGAPDDPLNLWPQPWHSEWDAKKKDQMENALHKKVCAQEISLAEAQHAMATNWIDAWNRYVLSPQGSYEIAGNSESKNGTGARKKHWPYFVSDCATSLAATL